MRIISTFKDYYDSISSYGVDKSIIYNRNLEIICDVNISNIKYCKSIESLLDSRAIEWVTLPKSEIGVIGFCGKLFPFMTFNNKDGKGVFLKDGSYIHNYSTTYCVTDELLKLNELLDSNTRGSMIHKDVRRRVNRFFDEVPKVSIDFVDVGCPVFALLKASNRCFSIDLIKNIPLSSVEFFRVKHPVEAFQEIQQYVSTRLVSEKEVPVKISDEILAQKKGFDKWSFRRHKDDEK